MTCCKDETSMACFDLEYSLNDDDDEALSVDSNNDDLGLVMMSKNKNDNNSRGSQTPLSAIDNFLPFSGQKNNFTKFPMGLLKGKTPSKDQLSPNPARKVAKKTPSKYPVSQFEETYRLTGRTLGRGAYAPVEACVNRITRQEYAVKIIDKTPDHSRFRIIKEIELFNLCAGHPNIVQLIEYFEEDDKFYLVFEIMRGGPLLNHIQRRVCFTEKEASMVVSDIANALKYLHDRGIAHRDLKPENVLCTNPDTVSPVKLCDLDLASKNVLHHNSRMNSITTPELQSPVGSAEFMAPEVVDAFVGDALSYDKRCDLWSLGVILYIMLCGYPPFYGECDRLDCGWNEGLPCDDCQDNLFAKIQLGRFDFPHHDWQHISFEAKDLITHLLERDVNRRYGVDDVLNHPFLVDDTPETPLQTANKLSRIDSQRNLAENFAAVDRFKMRTVCASRKNSETTTLQSPAPTVVLAGEYSNTNNNNNTNSIPLCFQRVFSNNDLRLGSAIAISENPANFLIMDDGMNKSIDNSNDDNDSIGLSASSRNLLENLRQASAAVYNSVVNFLDKSAGSNGGDKPINFIDESSINSSDDSSTPSSVKSTQLYTVHDALIDKLSIDESSDGKVDNPVDDSSPLMPDDDDDNSSECSDVTIDYPTEKVAIILKATVSATVRQQQQHPVVVVKPSNSIAGLSPILSIDAIMLKHRKSKSLIGQNNNNGNNRSYMSGYCKRFMLKPQIIMCDGAVSVQA